MSGERLVPIVIRIPADLHAALKERAAADERSMAAAIRYALRQYLREERPGLGRVSPHPEENP